MKSSQNDESTITNKTVIKDGIDRMEEHKDYVSLHKILTDDIRWFTSKSYITIPIN